MLREITIYGIFAANLYFILESEIVSALVADAIHQFVSVAQLTGAEPRQLISLHHQLIGGREHLARDELRHCGVS